MMKTALVMKTQTEDPKDMKWRSIMASYPEKLGREKIFPSCSKKWNSNLEILKNSYFLVHHTWDTQMLISVHKLRKAHHDIPATVLVCNGYLVDLFK